MVRLTKQAWVVVLLLVTLNVALAGFDCGTGSGCAEPSSSPDSLITAQPALSTGAVTRVDRSSFRNSSTIRAIRFEALATPDLSFQPGSHTEWLERPVLLLQLGSPSVAPSSPRAPPLITLSLA